MLLWYYLRSKAGATTRPCGGLWLVEGCGDTPPPATTRHMGVGIPLHQPQLANVASCGTRIILSNVYTHKTFHGLVYTNFIIELL